MLEQMKENLDYEIERFENEVENEDGEEKKYTALEVLALLYSVREC